MRIKITFTLIVVLFSLCFSTSTLPHSNEYLDTLEGEHGGWLRMSGPYHFELLAGEGQITLYITDHAGKRMGSGDLTGIALIKNHEKKIQITLMPKQENQLVGIGDFFIEKHTQIFINVTNGEGTTELISYDFAARAPKKSEEASGENHGSHDSHH